MHTPLMHCSPPRSPNRHVGTSSTSRLSPPVSRLLSPFSTARYSMRSVLQRAARQPLMQSRRQLGSSTYETLSLTQPAPRIVQVELSQPGKSNSMTRKFFPELDRCFRAISTDSSCRVVILTGAGKNFCSGLDLQDHAQLLGLAPGEGESKGGKAELGRQALKTMDFVARLQDSFATLRQCRKPVIAAVSGACIGGAMDLIMGADIRLCSKDAFFSVKEVDIGMAADLGTLQYLSKVMGNDSLAREMVYTARAVPAQEAKEAGLVSGLYPAREELQQAALAMASVIASKSPVAVQGSKVNMNYAQEHSAQVSVNRRGCHSANLASPSISSHLSPPPAGRHGISGSLERHHA
ncbi:unnamed protein product [Chrysoparadoxa australica]